MRDYSKARGLFSFLEFTAWVGIVLGTLIAIAGAQAAGNSGFGRASLATQMLGAMPGLVIMLFGLLMVAIVQSSRASVDAAEYGQQMLNVARDQLAVSKQALRLERERPASFKEAPEPAETGTPHTMVARPRSGAGTTPGTSAIEQRGKPTPPNRHTIEAAGFQLLNEAGTLIAFKGRQLEYREGQYHLNDVAFSNLGAAKTYLSQLGC